MYPKLVEKKKTRSQYVIQTTRSRYNVVKPRGAIGLRDMEPVITCSTIACQDTYILSGVESKRPGKPGLRYTTITQQIQ